MESYKIIKESDARYLCDAIVGSTVVIELCGETKRWTLYRTFDSGMRTAYCYALFNSLDDAEYCLHRYINKLGGNIFNCH